MFETKDIPDAIDIADTDEKKDSAGTENSDDVQNSGRKHYRKDNRRLANMKNTKSRKQEKMKRLSGERDSKKADLDRGYMIVSLDNVSDTLRVKHIPLDSADKEMIRSVIAEREYEMYELSLDIGEIDLKIRELATAKKSAFKDRLNKSKAVKLEDTLVKRVDRELETAMKNGSRIEVSEIQQQVRSGDKNEAYRSLKSFLSQKVATVSKKLEKSEKLERNVLNKVIGNMSKVQL